MHLAITTVNMTKFKHMDQCATFEAKSHSKSTMK